MGKKLKFIILIGLFLLTGCATKSTWKTTIEVKYNDNIVDTLIYEKGFFNKPAIYLLDGCIYLNDGNYVSNNDFIACYVKSYKLLSQEIIMK